MERTYTILFDRRDRLGARSLVGRIGLGDQLDPAARLLGEPPRPEIQRERLTTQELQELESEPGFVAAAEIMSTRLLSLSPAESVETAWAASGRRALPWGISAVGADKSRYTGAGVTVALLDTGIDSAHTAFRHLSIVEQDFTGLGNGDADGHGTHCAGTIFGRNVAGVRVGVAPGVRRALIAKVLGPEGGTSDMLVRALVWAHEQGAHVISMSLGLDFAATVRRRLEEGLASDLATALALESYRANLRLLDRLLNMFKLQEPFTGGAIIVAAAGDDSDRDGVRERVIAACPPSDSESILAVGSIDPATGGSYRVSSFSNCGVALAAPGRGVVSAGLGGGLGVRSGTSMAAPHVAGVAALWWQAVRQSDLPANATLVRGKLLASAEARGFSPAVYPAERGAGRVLAPQESSAVTLRPAGRPRQPQPAGQPAGIAWMRSGTLGDFESIAVDTGIQGRRGSRRLC